MIRVKYPFAVRHDGIDYAAGEVIEIEDTDCLVPGVVLMEHVKDTPESDKTESARKRSRAVKID